MQQPEATVPARRGVAGRATAALLVALVGAGLGTAVGRVSQSSAETVAAVPPAAPRAVVLLTGGAVDVGEDDLTGLEATGRADVLEGTGFVSGRTPLGRAVLGYLPDPGLDLVVVQGGEADAAVELPEGNVEVAALHLVDRVRAGGGARTAVVLVGPVPQPGGPTSALLEVRDELQAAAAARGVPFLDPVELGWTVEDDLDALLVEALQPLVPAGR